MPVVVVANPKGGVGKSTLSTHVAGYYASQGHSVMLGDIDRQQSSALWLRLRPPQARPIRTWDISHDLIARPPRDTTHVVLDTPAGLHGWRFKDVLKMADKVLVPLQPSIFDIYATRAFLDELAESRRADKLQVGIVGMRVDMRTIAADKLGEFVIAYEPVWAMVHKLRKAMGNRDAKHTLEGMIEMDEAYFTVESSEIEQGKGIRGKGAVGKQNVAIMAESTPLEDLETGKKEKHVRYFKAKVLEGHDGDQINQTIKESIDNQSIVFTDKSTSYVDIADFVELHLMEKSSKKTTEESLKWVHITISNAKRNLLGNYHKIKRKYLQLYLNEFIYKLNRRYFGEKLFERLVIANITGL